MSGIVYGLVDPKDNGDIRYVGKTTRSLDLRLRKHLETARRGDDTYRGRWIRSVLKSGRVPSAVVLEVVDAESLNEAERCWIANLRREGQRLTNRTDGGTGGNTLSPEARAERSEAMRLRWQDPEYRRRMSEAHLGKSLGSESRRKVSEGAKAAWDDPERRRQHSERQLGKPKRKHPPLTAEQRRNISEAGLRRWARERAS